MTDAWVQFLVGPAVLLVLGWLLNRKIDHVRVAARQTLDQVQNSHGSNLRDDLDAIAVTARHAAAGVNRLERSVGGIRDDLRQERRDRADLDNRLEQLRADVNQHIREGGT